MLLVGQTSSPMFCAFLRLSKGDAAMLLQLRETWDDMRSNVSGLTPKYLQFESPNDLNFVLELGGLSAYPRPYEWATVVLLDDQSEDEAIEVLIANDGSEDEESDGVLESVNDSAALRVDDEGVYWTATPSCIHAQFGTAGLSWADLKRIADGSYPAGCRLRLEKAVIKEEQTKGGQS